MLTHVIARQRNTSGATGLDALDFYTQENATYGKPNDRTEEPVASRGVLGRHANARVLCEQGTVIAFPRKPLSRGASPIEQVSTSVEAGEGQCDNLLVPPIKARNLAAQLQYRASHSAM